LRRVGGGELSEWPKEPDSKSGVGASLPRVRIPYSPPVIEKRKDSNPSGFRLGFAE
jgi:hypothetical protein